MIIEKKIKLTLILTGAGTLLVSIPLLMPVILSMIFLFRTGMFRFDYLMPAELFPLVFVGGGLLLWAAIHTRSQIKLIVWSYGLAILLLVASQVLSVLTGLASGATDTSSPWMLVVMGGLIGYDLLVIILIIAGIILIKSFQPLNLLRREK